MCICRQLQPNFTTASIRQLFWWALWCFKPLCPFTSHITATTTKAKKKNVFKMISLLLLPSPEFDFMFSHPLSLFLFNAFLSAVMDLINQRSWLWLKNVILCCQQKSQAQLCAWTIRTLCIRSPIDQNRVLMQRTSVCSRRQRLAWEQGWNIHQLLSFDNETTWQWSHFQMS